MKKNTGSGLVTKRREDRLARGLGWFSIGLGVAEFLTPRLLAKVIGVRAHPRLLRLLGVREIASGIGILTRPQPAGALQARVAGDAMDLALMGGAFLASGTNRGRLTMATAAVAGVTALDVLSRKEMAQRPGINAIAIQVKHSLIINRPPEELYEFWRNFERLPAVMSHLESVKSSGEKRTHWVAKGPAGKGIHWEAEIINEHPGEMIAWRSLEGGDIDHSGSVRFERAPGNRGTILHVHLQYQPPAGVLGATIAKIFGRSPEDEIKSDLLRLKQLLETGEVARTEGQPAGRSRSTSWKYDDLVRKE